MCLDLLLNWRLLFGKRRTIPHAIQHVILAQAPMEENLPTLQPIAWGIRLKKAAKKAVGNALRVTASLLAFSTGQCLPMLDKAQPGHLVWKGIVCPFL